MKFSKHLFISYTHIDNQKLEGQERGWVSRLHETLSVQLEMRLGEKVDIWRDNKLAGNDVFAEEIVAQFPDVGLLVSVVSPRYMNSEWCLREAREFCKAAEAAAGIQVARKSRIFKVVKLPVENLDCFPEAFRTGLGFPFYKSKDDVLIELDPAYGAEMVGDFNLSVAMLAQKLADTVKVLRAAGQPEQAAEAANGTLYLSETSWDREPERRLLETELTRRGYAVAPDRSLPSREQECEAEVAKLLASSKLAIHMIGSQPGMAPNGPSQRSVDALQNDLAARLSKARGLRRIVWIPQGMQVKNPAHQQFIETLTRSEDAQFGADVVTGDFELLKGAVLGALRKMEMPEGAASGALAAQSDSGKLIYVLCDRRDTKTTVELRKGLRQRGFDPQRPLFEGAASAIRQQNDALLNLCRSVIVYYGAGDEAWFRSTLTELEKVRRRVPVWTYVAGPATSHKQEILDEFEGGEIINGLTVETPEAELDRMLAGMPPRNVAEASR